MAFELWKVKLKIKPHETNVQVYKTVFLIQPSNSQLVVTQDIWTSSGQFSEVVLDKRNIFGGHFYHKQVAIVQDSFIFMSRSIFSW